jgi:RimJ/RimL family protein N-acetyltransferase
VTSRATSSAGWQDSERDAVYWIGKPFWGRGIATRALTAFLRELTDLRLDDR